MPISFNSFKEQIQESLEPITKKIDIKGPNVSKLFTSCVNVLTGSTPETRSRNFTKITHSRLAGLLQQVMKKPISILNGTSTVQKNGAAKNEIVEKFEKALSDRFDKSSNVPRHDFQELGKRTLDTLKEAHDSGHLDMVLYKRVLLKAEKTAAAVQARDLEGSDYDLAKQLTHELQSCSDESFKQKLSEFVFRSPSSDLPTADQAARKAYVDTHQFVSEILGTVDESIADLQAQLPKDLQLSLNEVCTIIDSVIAKGSDFSVAREMTVEVNGKSATVISRLDSDGKPDVLIRTRLLGKGASGEVFHAVSIKTQNPVVLKYASAISQELDDTDQEIKLLQHLNNGSKSNGVQSAMSKMPLRTDDGKELKVIIGNLYENRDLRDQVEVIRFASQELRIDFDHIDSVLQNPGLIRQKMGEYISSFESKLSSAKTIDEKSQIVQEFRTNTAVFIAKFMGDEALQFINKMCVDLLAQSTRE